MLLSHGFLLSAWILTRTWYDKSGSEHTPRLELYGGGDMNRVSSRCAAMVTNYRSQIHSFCPQNGPFSE